LRGKGLLILVVEDDLNDTFLLRRAFEKNRIDLPVHVCGDGAEALAYLRGEGAFGDRAAHPFPRVLITDLKMPRVDGFESWPWPAASRRREPSVGRSSF
jgi:CheY-like chemotaxis protein